MDEDSTLTQLAGAWTNIALGGEKAHDAYYAFQELMDKTQTSPILLNGAAAAHLAQQKWEEADGAVKEATEKDINCPETLINQIMVRSYVLSYSFKKIRLQLKPEKKISRDEPLRHWKEVILRIPLLLIWNKKKLIWTASFSNTNREQLEEQIATFQTIFIEKINNYRAIKAKY